MAPVEILSSLSELQLYIIHLLIGIGFGISLEQAGFGNSRLLAAQFYFKNLTVLKVMFTSIITAMILIFLTSGLGWLDYTRIWVNPTYLWPGIVGGIIMGVGFVIGGYCPGTSLVSMVTFKVDGALFVLGGLIGITLFGETVDSFSIQWSSSYLGRLTLFDVFGIPAGVMVLLAILLALGMFKGGEYLESRFNPSEKLSKLPMGAVAAFIIAAVIVIIIGQPTPETRWDLVKGKYGERLEKRTAFIHPAELVATYFDDNLQLSLWDFREEALANQFKIVDSRPMKLETLTEQYILNMRNYAPNRITVIIGTDEIESVAAYKKLLGYEIPNVYILDGGVRGWLEVFESHHSFKKDPNPANSHGFIIPEAKGALHNVSEPSKEWIKSIQYTPNIKLEFKRGVAGGGCG